jgi:hypothetical protein
MVVPQSVLQQNPQLGKGLAQAFMDQGVNPYRQVVGSGENSINPMTGQQEYFDLGKLVKQLAPIALSAFAPQLAAGTALGGISPFLLRAGTGALASKLGGGKTKDALMAGLLSGGLGAMVAGIALDVINFPAYGSGEEITESMLFNLGLLDGPFAMVWGLIAAFFYSGYKITRKYHTDIRDNLNQKKLYNS